MTLKECSTQLFYGKKLALSWRDSSVEALLIGDNVGRRRKTLGEVSASCYALALMRWLFGASVLLCLAGCGRKATRADCEAVVDKNVEVKLKADGVTDPELVAKRKEELRESLKEDIDKCVGKRVTDRMMTCVRNAETAEQIDKCLR